ncbi:MAG: hypothetical protein MUE72_11645 [Chitinophagaceae bacterium]|nr:hypothetical protein [Chitinophagaceae bacterium]
MDPVDQITISNYATFANNPILLSDPEGDCRTCYLTVMYYAYKAKYSSIINQAVKPTQRLVTGTSGTTPNNVGMNNQTRAVIKAGSKVKDLNTVTSTGSKVIRETGKDVGTVLDKGGEAVSDAGIVAAPFTGGGSLVLVPFGEGASAAGKVLKMTVYTLEGNTDEAVNEVIKVGVGATTGALTGAAIRQSIKKGNITNKSEEVIQKTSLGAAESVTNKAADEVITEGTGQ